MSAATMLPLKAQDVPFDDLMVAMDAVDHLRYEESMHEYKLLSDERRQATISRLREYYEEQGIAVPDHILEKAVDERALRHLRPVSMKPGLARLLALGWVRRRRYALRTLATASIAGGLLLSGLAAHHFLISIPQERAEKEERRQVEIVLPNELERIYTDALETAKEAGNNSAIETLELLRSQTLQHLEQGRAHDARLSIARIQTVSDMLAQQMAAADLNERFLQLSRKVNSLGMDTGSQQAVSHIMTDLERMAEAGNTDRFERTSSRLNDLLDVITTELDIRIVDREGVRSGVWRTNDGGRTRVYYLVVEALDPAGEPRQLPIRNFETGVTEEVSLWGVQVPEHVYRSVEADKTSDGIVDETDVGTKPSGTLSYEWNIPTTGNHMITRW